MLWCPQPMYFWFSKTAQGKALAKRAEIGIRGMIVDGTFDRIFVKYNKPLIDRLKLRTRRVLKADNPFLVPETPLSDKRLWFDPSTNH